VIGGGLSGLASAFFYQQRHGADARVLVIENNDDFGGHARRNEFTASNGRWLIGAGGSWNLDTPAIFSTVVTQMLDDVGVPTERFYEFNDQDLYEKMGLGSAVYFDEESWGRSHLTMKSGRRMEDVLREAPMAFEAKRDLTNLIESPPDYMPGLSDAEKKKNLLDLTYLAFLTDYARVHPDVIKYLFSISSGWWATGIDLIGCLEAWVAGYPGFDGMDLRWTSEPPYGIAQTNVNLWDYWTSGDLEPNIFFFPDGNHGVARALVRSLIPNALDGESMESLVTNALRHEELDKETNKVRLRLNSTAVRVEHIPSPDRAQELRVSYSRNERLEQVTGGACIFACWHGVIPNIAVDLPTYQAEALGQSFKLPLISGSVLIRNWEAFERMGIKDVAMPGSKNWSAFILDFPINMGSYESPSNPKDPMLLRFFAGPGATEPANSPREAAAAASTRIWKTPFANYERSIRATLAGAMGGGGFDPPTDIEAITINRWPQGYAYEYLRPNDAFWPKGPTPAEIGSQPFGRYAFANSDRGPGAFAHVAIAQAHRAVQELSR
jgi:spermidine dehydrogenase